MRGALSREGPCDEYTGRFNRNGRADTCDGNYVEKNKRDLENVLDLCMCVSGSIIWKTLTHEYPSEYGNFESIPRSGGN